MKRLTLGWLLGLLSVVGGLPALQAQQTAYSQTNLVANTSGVANHTDAQLSNPWGISFANGEPFWIANNNGGTSTLYDAQGNKQQLVVTIPGASVNPCNPGCPTGTVANTTADFNHGAFIFDTEDGIIANWTGANSAVVAVDNSPTGAVYKGLALLNNGSGNFLLAANFHSGKVDVFDRNFNLTALAGSFTDPHLPAGFAPHGIHVIDGQVYVAYGMQNAPKHDPLPAQGSGVVDVFDLNGNFVKTFATGGTLNAPWAVVATPATFGTFSNSILVGNFGDGTINAFDQTGKFLGQVSDTNGKPIVNPGLWDLVFGSGGTGDPNTLYFTAGGSNQTSGVFATLAPAAQANGPGFSLAVSATSATVAPGQSAMLSVSASAVGGFSSPIELSCSSVPTGVTCAVSPSTITPGSSSDLSTVTLTAAVTAPPGGYGGTIAKAGWMPLSGLGVFGMLFAGRKRKGKTMSKARKRIVGFAGLGALALVTLFTMACAGSSNHRLSPNTVTVKLTGVSGGISHSVPVQLTIQ